MQTNNSQSQTKKINLPAIFFLLAGSICAFIAAYLVTKGQYLKFGNVDYDQGPLIGYEIWGLGFLLGITTLCLYLLAAFCLFYQAKYEQLLTWWKVVLAAILATLVMVTFYPLPEFQLRHYHDGAYDTTFFLEQDEHDSFMGYFEQEAVNTIYTKEDLHEEHNFLCVESRHWWWGNFRVSKSVYPTLDEKNQAALLKQFCKQITEEEAFKRRTGS
jgi:hypothetical protein